VQTSKRLRRDMPVVERLFMLQQVCLCLCRLCLCVAVCRSVLQRRLLDLCIHMSGLLVTEVISSSHMTITRYVDIYIYICVCVCMHITYIYIYVNTGIYIYMSMCNEE